MAYDGTTAGLELEPENSHSGGQGVGEGRVTGVCCLVPTSVSWDPWEQTGIVN